ncbi:uncharacterized protein LOC128557464 [Mercenaria mercenaria]|uniref:uncharacterized protein LOC128557464 n=1 Tax=Mercenaria mercenaria TaxID=6596 RepID=UPI00234F9049|nr:uncharacterized protein LOC128557464 [Mercenaria mercenaria]
MEKKRKLTFSSDYCCFCQKQFISTGKQTLNPLKFDTLLSICKEQNNEISQNIVANEDNIRNGDVKLSYHKNCRTKFIYLKPFNSKPDVENGASTSNSDLATPPKYTRSQSDQFSWKENCFICGCKCSTKHRSKWSMVEGSIDENSKMYSQLLNISSSKNDMNLHSRLLSCKGDLVSVEARYHRGSKNKNCLSKYLLNLPSPNTDKVLDQSILEKVCTQLKNELHIETETKRSVLELTDLKSRMIELFEKHGMEIGVSMMRTNRLKVAFGKVWPELMFIPREGTTDLVCSREIDVDEALAKYVKLEKSFQSAAEQNDIEECLSSVFLDENANENTVLYEAAVILRRRIQQSHGLDNMYFSKDEININEQVKFLDPLLFQFVNWVASDSKLEDSHNDPDQRIVSVCSDITYLVKHVITPKHLGLSIYLHHSFGSKKLIEDLHSHGYTLSYNEYRQFLTSAALHASSMQKKTFSGAIIPAHMSREERPDDDLIVVAADNWDHNEATLSGKQSTHAMTSILVTGSNRCASERIPRVSERSINLSSLPGIIK